MVCKRVLCNDLILSAIVLDTGPTLNAFQPVRSASAGSRSPPRRPRPVLQRRLGSPGPRPPGQHRGPPRRLTPVGRVRRGPGDEAGGASPRRRAGGSARVCRAGGVRIGALNPPLRPSTPAVALSWQLRRLYCLFKGPSHSISLRAQAVEQYVHHTASDDGESAALRPFVGAICCGEGPSQRVSL